MAAQGHLAPDVAGNGAVIASFTSIAFSLSFVLRSRSPRLIARLGLAMLLIAASGLLGALAWGHLQPWVQEWLPSPGSPLRWGEPPLSFRIG